MAYVSRRGPGHVTKRPIFMEGMGRMGVYMYVCVYMCMCVYVYVCICVHVYIYVCVHMRTCVYICVPVCYVYMYV